ncbi:MAG: iron-sulfur cluster assembly protein [Candidatus Cryosericum sp.]|nr:iron-sulfur cluster assembly protein [bacterium]
MVTEEQILDVLRTVYDPEIPINVVDLGLVYGVEITKDSDVTVRMTMTAPQCPMGSYIVEQAEQAIRTVAGVNNVRVDLVFDPPWDISMIKEDAAVKAGLIAATPAAETDNSTDK